MTSPTPQPYYAKAPVREAILEIRPHLKNGQPSLEKLEEIMAKLPEEFVKQKDVIQSEFGIDLKDEASPKLTSGSKKIGYLKSTEDGRFAVQVSTSSFFLAHFPPYSNGDVFFKKFAEIVDAYKKVLPFDTAARFGLRFINIFNVSPDSDTEEYLKITSSFRPPEGYNFNLMRGEHMLQGKTAEDPRLKMHFEAKIVEDKLQILLDVDTYVVNVRNFDSQTLVGHYKKLRGLKNSLFEDNLTEKAKDLFR